MTKRIIDFADKPYGLLFRDNANVVIMRTLSKIGLAAIRLGYMMGDRRLVEQINKVRLPYNINSITQAIASESVRSWDMLLPSFEKIIEERERVSGLLRSMSCVTAYPSGGANFILIRVGSDPEKIFNALLAGGVRVRWFKGNERLNNCFRVTIGTPAENDTFLGTFKKACECK